jgi:hypothetical protein
LHLLATGLPEEDAAKYLRLLDPDHVNINQDLISCDIDRYINSILDGEDSFEQWGDEINTNIKNAVLESAGRMYVLFFNVLNNDYLTVICSMFLLVSL